MSDEKIVNGQLNKRRNVILDVIVIALLIFTLFFVYFATNVWLSVHVVKNVSMQSTLLDGDIVFADKLANPKRGDVVIFEYDTNVDYVKRVIATEGDTIFFEKEGDEYKVYVKYSGEDVRVLLDEPYLDEGTITSYKSAPTYVVGEGELFVMGDNREESYDSRDFGTINQTQVKGVVHNFFISIKGFTKVLYGKN